MWFKPNLSNVIIRKIKSTFQNPIGQSSIEIEFYEITETGVKMDSSILNWLFIWALNNKKNILYMIDGGINYYGSKEFVEKMDSKHNQRSF